MNIPNDKVQGVIKLLNSAADEIELYIWGTEYSAITEKCRSAAKELELNLKADDKQPRKNNSRFIPPAIEEVTEYCRERNNTVNPQSFIDHYEAGGWLRGKTKIKSWKACVRTWENNSHERDTRTSAKRVSDKLDEIAAKDIRENGHTANMD